MKIKPIFRWYDIWIGFYWDKDNRVLYCFPIPMFGLKIQFKNKFEWTEDTLLHAEFHENLFGGGDFFDSVENRPKIEMVEKFRWKKK